MSIQFHLVVMDCVYSYYSFISSLQTPPSADARSLAAVAKSVAIGYTVSVPASFSAAAVQAIQDKVGQ